MSEIIERNNCFIYTCCMSGVSDEIINDIYRSEKWV